jgi:hypothetical protein
MVLVLLAQKDQKVELAGVIAETLVAVCDDSNETLQIRQTALDCLIEIETDVPVSLTLSLLYSSTKVYMY